MSKSSPEKDIFQAGQTAVVTLTPATAAIFVGVVQKSILAYARNLTLRVDLDNPARLEAFDKHVQELVLEAKNFPLERTQEAAEAQARATVCQIVGTAAHHARPLLVS